MGTSLAQQMAELPDAELEALIADLTPEQARTMLTAWWFLARPEQLTPAGDWRIWLLLCGRGFGKTRTGAENFLDWVLDNPVDLVGKPTEWLIAGKRYEDTVNAMMMGQSGIYHVLENRGVTWHQDNVLHRITLSTGQIIHFRYGDNDNLARSLNLVGAWLDEFGIWTRKVREMWTMSLNPAVRIQTPNMGPRILITTTPKVGSKEALDLLKDFIKRAAEGRSVVVTQGTTFDNAANLAPGVLEEYLSEYPKGSTAYRQELMAEIVDQIEGAIWADFKWIDDHRCRPENVPDLFRKLVVVDPAIKTGPDSDQTGIIYGGTGHPVGATEDHVYILQDLTMKAKASVWVEKVVDLCIEEECYDVLVEVDQGGDVWADLIRDEARRRGALINVHEINASSIGGKAVRAQGVVGLYQQGRIHHVWEHPHLETQQTTWVPGDKTSPDRMDAAVYLIRRLMGIDRDAAVTVAAYDMY